MWASTDTNFDYGPGAAGRTDATRPILRLLKRVLAAIPAWQQRSAWRSELAALDDRTLADLAINRGDFPAILAGTFNRPSGATAPTRRAAAARAAGAR